ncbi:putative reverse transcriptase domain-containing protein, partial [Tanacetum coccineum]
KRYVYFNTYHGVNLVVRRSCLTPKADGDDWLKHNIFQSTCTISGKVCTFVCESGSCDNLIAAEAVQKLGLKTENHLKTYKLQWLKKGCEVKVSKCVHVPFSMGNTYKDNVWCDVVPMDACHLLLGRPGEYDRDITHNGRTNTYSFLFGGVKITLMPNKPKEVIIKPTGTLLTLSQFEDELEMGDEVFVLIRKEVTKDSKIPEAMIPLLEEFSDAFPDELPDGLPPLRDIQDHIDLEPGSQLPNKSHYRMSLREHKELRRHVEELVSKGHVRESMSSCAVPALLTPKKDGTWRMCIDSQAINKITMRPFIGKFVVVYFDDILIYSASFNEHVTHVRQVLTLLRKDSFYAATKKYVFMTPKVLFWGYVVSGDGIQVDESKVAVVQEWPTSTTITEVRSFHGLVSFYRRFIPNFSSIMAPLTDCMKGKSFVWTKEAELAFQVVKENLTTAPILILPDFSKVFELHTDASNVAIGGVLSQGGRPVAYFSEKLTKPKSSRMELYMMNKPNGRMILASVEEGPLDWPSIIVDGVTRLKEYTELTPAEAIQVDCNIKAINIILQGLPTEIYALVSQHRVAKDLWEKIKLLMQGTSLTKQERECKLYDEFDKFTYKKGESLHEYYLRFTLLLNDMNIYKMPLEQFQVNTKFLNTLPNEWSKFVTDVKLVRDLHTTNVDQLHAYLKQHERHANEVRLMHERNSDPLALVASHQIITSVNLSISSTHSPELS